jgi:hypothetical protein
MGRWSGQPNWKGVSSANENCRQLVVDGQVVWRRDVLQSLAKGKGSMVDGGVDSLEI